MTRVREEQVLQEIRRLAASTASDEVADQDLLERFLKERDEASFAALVRRHGPMVWNVCRRALHDRAEAEDVFQAAFVILAQKAASIRRRASLASWLYGVTYRLALRARGNIARRERLVRHAAVPTTPDPLAEVSGRELLGMIDSELERLPEHLRAPILLCYLEGRSQDEAALQLGWSKTTLRGRLERARDLLRRRLARRGVPLSAALLPAALASTGSGLASELLVAAGTRTALAATSRAAATGAVAPAVLDLARGLTREWFVARVRSAVFVALALGLLGGVLTLAYAAWAQRTPAPEVPPEVFETQPALAQPARDRFGDPLPPQALLRLGTVRMRHGGEVSAVIVSHDGNTIISGAEDGFLRFWAAENGREIGQHNTHPKRANFVFGWPQALALSPSGQTLAVGMRSQDQPKTLRIIDVVTREQRAALGDSGMLHSVAFLSDTELISGDEKGDIRYWDLKTNQEQRRLTTGHKSFAVLALSADRKTIASGGRDGIVHLWNAASGERLRTLQGVNKRVDWLAFAPAGRTLAVSGYNDVLSVWDVAAGTMIRKHGGNFADVDGPLAFAPDGKSYACGGSMRHITIWEAATGKQLRCFHAHEDGGVIQSLIYTADGRWLVSGAQDGTVRIHDPATGKERQPVRGHGDAVRTIAFAPDGKTIVTGSRDSTMRVWDRHTGAERYLRDFTYRFKLPGAAPGRNGMEVESLRFTPDGSRLVAAAANSIFMMDPATGKTIGHVKRPDKEQRRMFGSLLCVGHDGKTIAISMIDARNDQYVALADIATGKLLHEFPGGKDNLSDLAYASQAGLLGSANYGGSGIVQLYDANNRTLAGQIKSGNSYTRALAFAPDGRTLAVGGSGGGDSKKNVIELWDPRARKLRGTLDMGPHSVYAIVFAPDGLSLAAAASDHAVHLFELASMRPRGRFVGHRGPIRALAVAPDGRALASASADTTALVWDLSGGRTPRELTEQQWRAAWEELAGDDAAQAYRAMWTLAADPHTPARLRELLEPLTKEEAAQLKRWIQDMDSAQFEVREQARSNLERKGYRSVPALETALDQDLSLEARRRVEQLLDKLMPLTPARLREIRAIEALGSMAGADARRLLENLAAGQTHDPLTRDARAILEPRLAAEQNDADTEKR